MSLYPLGLRPVTAAKGGVHREQFAIDPAGGVALYPNDPVTQTAAGLLVRGVAGSALLGAICGINRPDGTPEPFYPGTGEGWTAEVATEPEQEFVADDPTWTLMNHEDRGANVDLAFLSGITGRSAMVLATSPSATATSSFRLLRPLDTPEPYLPFPSEARMLKYVPLTREQGRTETPYVGELVWREDLGQWFTALNTDNADMGDWRQVTPGSDLKPRRQWIVMINNHIRRTTTGIS